MFPGLDIAIGAPKRDFTIEYPTVWSPLPGEVVRFSIENYQWQGVRHEYRDCVCVWDFGDSGATYDIGEGAASSDANVAVGWDAGHAYATAGTYTVTATITDNLGNSVVKTTTVTVEDPDSDVTWTHDLYCDWGEVSGTPEFSWAPAEAGTVVHVETLTELKTFFDTTANEDIRITLKDDETFTLDASTLTIRGAGSRVYVTRSGTGTDRPKFLKDATDVANPYFINIAGNLGVTSTIITGVDGDGGYDPVQGDRLTNSSVLVESLSDSAVLYDRYVSLSNGVFTGYSSVVEGGGSTFPDDVTYNFAFNNVDISDWFDYGILLVGRRKNVVINGCKIMQNVNALIRDDKINVFPQAADHGPIRIQAGRRVCVENCKLASSSGWSFDEDGFFFSRQVCVRLTLNGYSEKEPKSRRFTIARNISVGTGFCNISVGDGAVPIENTIQAMCGFENFHYRLDNTGTGIFSTASGNAFFQNNVEYISDIHLYNAAISTGQLELYTNDIDGYRQTVRDGPIVFEFNTLLADSTDAQLTAENWETDNNYILDTSGAAASKTFPDVTVENGIIEVTNFANAASFTDYTPLSRAEKLKPVTGSAAINQITTGYPVRDHLGNTRSSTTHIGAHHTVDAVDAGVSAPTNSVAPTIAELDNFTGEYYLNSLGTWANLDEFTEYLMEFDWRINGASIPHLNQRHSYMSSSSGTLTSAASGNIFPAKSSTGATASDIIAATQVSIDLTFGSGTVELQSISTLGGSWSTEGSPYTTNQTGTVVGDGSTLKLYRLKCTAYTSDITFTLSSNGVDTLSCRLLRTNMSGTVTPATASNSVTV